MSWASVKVFLRELLSPAPPIELPAPIRQPWAWLILNAGKDVENRSWQTHFRGWFLIHAAKGCTIDEYLDAADFARVSVQPPYRGKLLMPALKNLDRGGIVGMAKLGNCVRGCESPWFVGAWGFVLDEVKPLTFRPCKGALGFFCPQPQ